MKTSNILFLSLSFLLSVSISAQKFKNNWYFGNKGGLNFDGDSANLLTNSAMVTSEGCASISDQEGNLLFYSNGEQLWDKSHQVMPNGDGLLGSTSSVQSCLAAPVIGSQKLYYLFTVDGRTSSTNGGYQWDGLTYSIIDMTLPGNGSISDPYGDIVSAEKNKIILDDSLTEGITAILHENEDLGYWIVVRKHNANKYYSYLITQDGVCSKPIISDFPNEFITDDPSALKASFDGRTLVDGTWKDLRKFDFDRSTGKLNNYIQLASVAHRTIAFSPNDSLIYAKNGTGDLKIFKRFSPDIIASEKVIHVTGFYSLLLGPNGKIYGTGWNKIDVIHDPNNYDNPNIENSIIDMGSANAAVSFPNFFDHFDKVFSYSSNWDTSLCHGDTINIPAVLDTNSFWASMEKPLNENISNPPIAIDSGTVMLVLTHEYADCFWNDTFNIVGMICDTIVDTIMDSTLLGQDSVINEILFVPNAFSPDGDGENDYFEIKSNQLTDFYIKFYDKLGKLVYETNDHAFRWDGQGLRNNTNLTYVLSTDGKLKIGNVTVVL